MDETMAIPKKPVRISKCSRVPFVEQMEQSECGLCCLAMVFSFYKSEIPLLEFRDRGGGGRDGTNLKTLRDIARSLGMESNGHKVHLDQLNQLRLPAILHWRGDHFIVLERMKENKIYIVDPAKGRLVLSREELEQDFSGTVLSLYPGSLFTKWKKQSVWIQYLQLLKNESWLVSSMLVWTLWIQLLALITPFATRYLLDYVILPKDSLYMTQILTGMICLIFIYLFISFIRGRILVQLQNKLDVLLMSRFFERLLHLPYQFFQLRTSGDLILRANSNMMIREILSSRTVSMLLDGGLVLMFLLYMLKYSLLMTGFIVLIGVMQVSVLLISNSHIKRLTQEEIIRQTAAASFLTESIHGILSVKSEGVEKLAYEQWSKLFRDQIKAAEKRGFMGSYVETINSTLKFAAPLFLLWMGAWQVLSENMTVGTMFGFYTLAVGFLGPLYSLVSTCTQMTVMGRYFNRIMDILSAPVEQDKGKEGNVHELKGEIRLDNVSFQYNQYSQSVLRNISLCIESGEKVAIVGSSGSGKSTLACLLLGLYKPTEGSISFDQVNLDQLDKTMLRKQMGVVMQHTTIFNRSIYENISLHHPKMSPELVLEAAKLAEIHEDILRMPMQYGTMLSETGSNISGGQKQRIALARALTHRPKILLLDEATSALDAKTEQRIQENLAHLSCTRIVIAHRLSTILDSDKIIVLNRGEIVEVGTHHELLNKNGHYAQFYQKRMEEQQNEKGVSI
ncbi:peptidase domain-containing ABC transporter [Neobacillus cucumis]|uniref:peptidase domain-containing ABC transporter n=1 Tax=Neobacillus cucumis TaxID=1740721 RepID=UPI002E2139CA|nr:peptidase domain-containing ABC transporter [Neobacillus cucumis]